MCFRVNCGTVFIYMQAASSVFQYIYIYTLYIKHFNKIFGTNTCTITPIIYIYIINIYINIYIKFAIFLKKYTVTLNDYNQWSIF